MKQFLINGIKFIGFFVPFYILTMLALAICSYFTGAVERELFAGNKHDGDNYFRTLDLYEWFLSETQQDKGLVLGSSTAGLSINPATLTEETGISFFNCASAAQTPELSYILLKQAVANTDIKYLVMDVSPVVWEEEISYPAYDWITNNSAPQNKYVFEMAWRAHQFQLWNCYAYFTIKRLLPHPVEYKVKSTAKSAYVKNGLKTITRNVPKTSPTYREFYTMNAKNKEGLKNIVRLCNEKNIRLVLLHSRVLNSKIDWNVVQVDGLPVIDATKYNIDPDCFYDSHHMYVDCTTGYTQWVGLEINKRIGR